MNYMIYIDINTDNNYINLIGDYLYKNLLEKGYDVILLDNNIETNDKIKLINERSDNVIVISNKINANGEGIEIIYALRNTDSLSRFIEANLKNFINVSKYYQLRLPNDTSLDYYQIIRETPNAESLIINYGYNDLNNIGNNWNNLAKSIFDGIIAYTQKENIYLVKSGDSLYSIARNFNVSIDDIKNANNLTTNALKVGQELIIPSKETLPTIKIYTVKSGDNLYSIARAYNTTVNELKEINNLSSNALSIGQILKLPGGTIVPKTNTYVVKSGDNLYSIARTYNTTINELKAINNLTSNNLSIGQILKLPTKTDIPNTYVVKSGDNLYSIARLFNTTINELKEINNLTSNILSIGQILNIPTK